MWARDPNIWFDKCTNMVQAHIRLDPVKWRPIYHKLSDTDTKIIKNKVNAAVQAHIDKYPKPTWRCISELILRTLLKIAYPRKNVDIRTLLLPLPDKSKKTNPAMLGLMAGHQNYEGKPCKKCGTRKKSTAGGFCVLCQFEKNLRNPDRH